MKKLFMLLMLLQVILVYAKEGVVLRIISSPTESRIMLDTNNDGQADMYISMPSNYTYIRNFFERGIKVEIDDDYLFHDGNMSFAYLGGVLAIDGVSPVIITGNNELFEAAVERARRQRTGR